MAAPDDGTDGRRVHAFGQTCALNATVSVGGCLRLIPRVDGGKALEILERDRVTLFEGVPTADVVVAGPAMARRLLDAVAACAEDACAGVDPERVAGAPEGWILPNHQGGPMSRTRFSSDV